MACLSAAQIEIIQATWKNVGGSYIDFGEAVLISFLEKYPQHLPVFVELKDKSLDELKVIETFLHEIMGFYKLRHFGSKVMNFVGMLVDTLDKDGMDAIKAMIIELGHFHVNRGLTNKQAFKEIKGVFVEVIADMYNLTETECEAWSTFLNIFAQVIFSVFDGKA